MSNFKNKIRLSIIEVKHSAKMLSMLKPLPFPRNKTNSIEFEREIKEVLTDFKINNKFSLTGNKIIFDGNAHLHGRLINELLKYVDTLDCTDTMWLQNTIINTFSIFGDMCNLMITKDCKIIKSKIDVVLNNKNIFLLLGNKSNLTVIDNIGENVQRLVINTDNDIDISLRGANGLRELSVLGKSNNINIKHFGSNTYDILTIENTGFKPKTLKNFPTNVKIFSGEPIVFSELISFKNITNVIKDTTMLKYVIDECKSFKQEMLFDGDIDFTSIIPTTGCTPEAETISNALSTLSRGEFWVEFLNRTELFKAVSKMLSNSYEQYSFEYGLKTILSLKIANNIQDIDILNDVEEVGGFQKKNELKYFNNVEWGWFKIKDRTITLLKNCEDTWDKYNFDFDDFDFIKTENHLKYVRLEVTSFDSNKISKDFDVETFEVKLYEIKDKIINEIDCDILFINDCNAKTINIHKNVNKLDIRRTDVENLNFSSNSKLKHLNMENNLEFKEFNSTTSNINLSHLGFHFNSKFESFNNFPFPNIGFSESIEYNKVKDYSFLITLFKKHKNKFDTFKNSRMGKSSKGEEIITQVEE